MDKIKKNYDWALQSLREFAYNMEAQYPERHKETIEMYNQGYWNLRLWRFNKIIDELIATQSKA